MRKKFDGEYPDRFEKEIFQYLSLDRQHFPWASQLFEQPKMDREYFMHLADRFRSPHPLEIGRTTCGNCVTPPTRATAKCFGATRRAPTTKYKAKSSGTEEIFYG